MSGIMEFLERDLPELFFNIPAGFGGLNHKTQETIIYIVIVSVVCIAFLFWFFYAKGGILWNGP